MKKSTAAIATLFFWFALAPTVSHADVADEDYFEVVLGVAQIVNKHFHGYHQVAALLHGCDSDELRDEVNQKLKKELYELKDQRAPRSIIFGIDLDDAGKISVMHQAIYAKMSDSEKARLWFTIIAAHAEWGSGFQQAYEVGYQFIPLKIRAENCSLGRREALRLLQ